MHEPRQAAVRSHIWKIRSSRPPITAWKPSSSKWETSSPIQKLAFNLHHQCKVVDKNRGVSLVETVKNSHYHGTTHPNLVDDEEYHQEIDVSSKNNTQLIFSFFPTCLSCSFLDEGWEANERLWLLASAQTMLRREALFARRERWGGARGENRDQEEEKEED